MGGRTTTVAAVWALTFLAMATLGQNTAAQSASAMDSYQGEVTVGYKWRDIDTNPDIELTDVLLEGIYNFEPVSLQGHPWNEAAFLEHSMQGMLSLAWSKFELSTFDADGLVYGAGYRYAAKDVPVAGEVIFKTGTLDGDMGLDVDLTYVDASLGYWVEPNAIAGIAFNYTDLDPDGTFKIEQTTVAAFGKIVHKLDDERAINAEARAGWTSVDTGTSDDGSIVLTLEGDYYFTPQYSAGALLDFQSGDANSQDGTTLGVRGSAWFTPQVGISVQYSKFWADGKGADEDGGGIYLSVRF
jgi:hypothetical protein